MIDRKTLLATGVAVLAMLSVSLFPPGRDARADEENGDASTGVLQGRVSFRGEVPPPRAIEVTSDHESCGAAAGEIRDVVVSEEGGLAGAIVEIQRVPEPEGGWDWNHPEEGYALRQEGCAFVPSLLVVPEGTELLIYNDDAVAHNVQVKGGWNIMQPAGREEPARQEIRFRGQSLLEIACSYHPWMKGWIYVARSPCYAVTDAEGNYRIEGVPPGEYRVLAIHPVLGKERAGPLAFTAGEAGSQDFTFTAE